MVNFTILAGGFSSFIATYVFDSDLNALSLIQENPTGTNPSWIAPSLQNPSILYAVNELNPGGNLQSFTVDATGGLTLVDTVVTNGNGPTFTVQLSTGEVTAANFGSPNASLIATVDGDPLRFQTSPAVEFPVNGGPSNPHMTLEVGDEVLVPDLGADKIWRLVRDGEPGNFKVQGQIDIDAGSGPRHIAVLDGILFTIHEKTSTLTAQQIPEAPNGTTLPLIANVSIIPANTLDGTKFAAAEILISNSTDDFPEPLIYVSNRNIGETIDPAGDTIAIFRFNSNTEEPIDNSGAGGQSTNGTASSSDTGCDTYTRRDFGRHRMLRRSRRFSHRQVEPLELLAQVPTGLQQIRSMALGNVADGSDKFLIAGANTVGGVAVFERVDGGQNLNLLARNEDIGNRTSFVWLPVQSDDV